MLYYIDRMVGDNRLCINHIPDSSVGSMYFKKLESSSGLMKQTDFLQNAKYIIDV